MIILTKKRFCFRNGNEKIETAGNGIVETVPDWVAETPLFQLAVNDGALLEVKSKGRTVSKAKPKKTADKAETTKEKPAEVEAEKTE